MLCCKSIGGIGRAALIDRSPLPLPGTAGGHHSYCCCCCCRRLHNGLRGSPLFREKRGPAPTTNPKTKTKAKVSQPSFFSLSFPLLLILISLSFSCQATATAAAVLIDSTLYGRYTMSSASEVFFSGFLEENRYYHHLPRSRR